MRIPLITLGFGLLCSLAQSQVFTHSPAPILLANPSFEGNVGYGVLPGGWFSCAFNAESPPDTHPVPEGHFGVTQKPKDGVSYLGMVVRDNGTTELVSHKLQQPFLAGQCYSLSVHLCKSEHLRSRSRLTNFDADYDNPTVLRIWGGASPCGKKELLAVSPPIGHTAWVKYSFLVKSLETLQYLSLEAYYVEGSSRVYNGNILIDDFSPILPIDCGTLQYLVNADTLQIPAYKFKKAALPVEGELTNTNYYKNIGSKTWMLNLNEVLKPEALPSLLVSNCDRIGFGRGEHKLSASYEIGLLEVAYNVAKFPGQYLEIAIANRGDRLNKRRAKAIGHVFKDAGLVKRKYSLIFIELADANMAGWSCGGQEVWLRVGPKQE
jgi:hypothetical protein